MKEESSRNTKKLSEMVDLFIILMVVMVSQVSTPLCSLLEYAQFIVCQSTLIKQYF